MLRLARGWWASDGSEDYFDRVEEILDTDPSKVPELIRAMVDTAPEGRLARIGTGPVETLQMAMEFGWRETPTTMELVLAAELTPAELFGVLKGAYPNYIVDMDVARWTAGILTAEQVAWLSKPGGQGRYE